MIPKITNKGIEQTKAQKKKREKKNMEEVTSCICVIQRRDKNIENMTCFKKKTKKMDIVQ